MSDIQVSGDTVIRSDSPPPAESSHELEMPSGIRAGDAAFSVEDLGSIAEQSADHRVSEKDWLDNSLGELKQKRQRDGDGLDGNPPVIEIKASRQDEPYTLREAQKEYSEGHRLYSATAALANARRVVGDPRPVTNEEVYQADREWEESQKAGLSHKPSEPAFNPMGMMTDGGKLIDKIPDHQKVTLDHSLKLEEGARLLGNWREHQEAMQNALIEHLQGEEVKRQIDFDEAKAREAAQAAELRQQPRQPQQTRQPQVDPLAAQKAHLAAQAAALQMSGEQKQILENQQAWINHLRKNCPEADSIQSWNYTVQTNPQRAQEIIKQFQKAQPVFVAGHRRLGEINEVRQARAANWWQGQAVQHQRYQQAAAAHRERMHEACDNQFQDWLAREMPDVSKGKGLERLRAAARAELRSAGLSEAQIDHEWRHGPTLRHPAAQAMVARAAYSRLQREAVQERANNRARIPAAQAPSVAGLRHNDAEADINALQRRLEGQSGRNAIMTAVELQKARRKAGRAG